MRIALLLLGTGIILLALLELALRVKYGLGYPPLYVADARTGYRLAPNQRLRRRGHRIEINQYSMRGPAITPHRSIDTLRVLLLGDSIVNGGWWTDQSQLLSVIVEGALPTHLPEKFQRFEVLNASANSWGPRNELGYVRRFGTFEAQVVLLVLNTDDLFAIAPNAFELGRNPAYPTRRPPLALAEALARRRPRPLIPELQALHDQPGDRVGVNLEAIRQLHRLVQDSQGQLLLAITPLRRELDPDGPRDYEWVARQRLKELALGQGIPYLDFLPRFKQGDYPGLYLDHIHLNAQGNAVVGQALAQFIADSWGKPAGGEAGSGDDPSYDLW
ncbi:MAG: SGNH/GDSL hydrolase family protein [Nodosilinea sp.]